MAKKDKRVIQKEFSANAKRPEIAVNPNAYLSKHPVWSFHRCDTEYEKWSIKNTESFCDDILDKLISYEGLTWAEIQAASGGKRKGNGTNNHFEYISEMIKEAQKRAETLHLDVDQLFSLRLSGEVRLYGILDDGIFYALWLDQKHEIYPPSKR